MPGAPSPSERFLAALAPLSLVVLACAQLWPGLSAGLSPPIGWDHGAHLGKAMLTWREVWPSLRGWTDQIEAGVPLHTLYTPTGTLWTLLFRCVTPMLAWHQTYALAFTGFRALVGLSVYRLARVSGAGVLGALAAGALALADEGDHSEGGWFYDVQFGVWPMSFAMCVFFLGLADLLLYLDGGARRHGARAMLLLGVALFSHQASLLALGAILPSLVVARAIERTGLRRDVARLAAVLGVALPIACWWMLPMLALSAWMDDHGQLYRSAPDIGAALAEGRGVLRGGPWVGPLVGLGLAAGALGRGHRRGLALGALVAMLIATPGWLLELDAVRFLPSLGRIVFPRMMMIAKPLMFALAGFVVHDVATRLAPGLRASASTWTGRAGLGITAALAAPFLAGAPGALHTALVQRDTVTTSSLPDWDDRQAAWAWLRARPSAPFFRVLSLDDTTHLPQAAPAFSGHPGLVHGVLVGEAFRNTVDSLDPATLREVNVRYIVTAGLPPGALRPATHEVARFGAQGIFELEGWTGAVAVAPGAPAQPRVQHLERERVVVSPEGARTVVVRRAFSPGWRADVDGVDVPILPHEVPGSARLRLMRVELPAGAASLTMVYRGVRAPMVVGFALTALGLFAVLLFATWPRWPEAFRQRVDAALHGARSRVPAPLVRHAHHLALAAPVLALGALALRGAAGHHFAFDLDRATVSLRHADGRIEACVDAPAEGRGWACASAPHASVRRVSQIVDGWFRGCITAPPPAAGGTLVIEWPEAPLGSSLRFGAGVGDDAHMDGLGDPVSVAVIVDGHEQTRLSVPGGRAWLAADVGTPAGTHALRVEVASQQVRSVPLCFDAIAR